MNLLIPLILVNITEKGISGKQTFIFKFLSNSINGDNNKTYYCTKNKTNNNIKEESY